MAIGATIHTFDIELADVDRGVYESLSLRVAQHPSETAVFMVTRVLAYCLAYEEGITFGAGGVSSTDEPAVLVRDLTGTITHWVEIGSPDAQRMHHGMKLAGRASAYTHRDISKLLMAWNGKTIHRADEVVVRAFDPKFIEDAAAALARRNEMTVSITEGQIYLELNGVSLTSELGEHSAV